MNNNRCIQVGMLSGGKWDKIHENVRRIFSAEGISPTVNTCEGGYREVKIIEPIALDEQNMCIRTDGTVGTLTTDGSTPKHNNRVIEPCICASRGRNPENPSDRTSCVETEQRLEVNEQGTSNTLTSVAKYNYVIEPCVLTPQRNDYGKAIRKEYEKGNVTESRHNMSDLLPKAEPVSNTLTSVQKDNLVVEPKLVGGVGEINWGKQYHQGNRIYDSEEIAMCLNSQPVGNTGGNSYLYQVEKPTYRIRKLTPKECIRLMDFDDSDYDKIKAIGMSDSAIYKQCGNSIVVACLKGIFDKMFIHTEVENEQLSFIDGNPT